MQENTTENKIRALIASWNKITGQSVNAARFINQGYAFIEAGVTDEEIERVAKYLIAMNKKASEPRYRRELSLYRIMSDIAFFESQNQSAMAFFRNHKPKTDRDSVLAAAGDPVERDMNGQPVNHDPTRRISIDLVTQSLKNLKVS